MNIEYFRNYCISKWGVTEEFPFNETALVFKVSGKIFALTNIDTFASISLKCDPEKAISLREQYEAVQPGYHLNKKHWNTILMDGSVPDPVIINCIDHSYELVFHSLPTKKRHLHPEQ